MIWNRHRHTTKWRRLNNGAVREQLKEATSAADGRGGDQIDLVKSSTYQHCNGQILQELKNFAVVSGINLCAPMDDLL